MRRTLILGLILMGATVAGCGGAPALAGFEKDQDSEEFRIHMFIVENPTRNAYGNMCAHMEGVKEVRVDEQTTRFTEFTLDVPLDNAVIGPREIKRIPVRGVVVPGRVHIDKTIWHLSEYKKVPWPRPEKPDGLQEDAGDSAQSEAQ